MYTELEALRDALTDIDCVKSCRIGYEQGITPALFPMIRLVPSQLTPGKPYSKRVIEVAIIFGWNLPEAAEGIEAVYEGLSDLEAEIITALRAYGGRYISTLTDEDRVSPYKLMQVLCEIEGTTPATDQT